MRRNRPWVPSLAAGVCVYEPSSVWSYIDLTESVHIYRPAGVGRLLAGVDTVRGHGYTLIHMYSQ